MTNRSVLHYISLLLPFFVEIYLCRPVKGDSSTMNFVLTFYSSTVDHSETVSIFVHLCPNYVCILTVQTLVFVWELWPLPPYLFTILLGLRRDKSVYRMTRTFCLSKEVSLKDLFATQIFFTINWFNKSYYIKLLTSLQILGSLEWKIVSTLFIIIGQGLWLKDSI